MSSVFVDVVILGGHVLLCPPAPAAPGFTKISLSPRLIVNVNATNKGHQRQQVDVCSSFDYTVVNRNIKKKLKGMRNQS